jgi:synaptobrevin family protein YKT6
MKVFSICLYHNDIPIKQSFNLESFGFFEKRLAKEMLSAISKTCIDRTIKGSCVRVDKDDKYCMTLSTNVMSVCVTCDQEYPQRVTYKMCSDIIHKNDLNIDLDDLITKSQDPKNIDKILFIQQNVDETKEVLHKTINQLLERGEKLDDLILKSDQLSAVSKQFYKEAQKHNRCCKAY